MLGMTKVVCRHPTLACPFATYPILSVTHVRFWDLRGWNPHMEWSDLLHVMWCGVCRDLNGSLLLDLAEFCIDDSQATSWDGRLAYLHHHCVEWCSANNIRPSTVEPFSSLRAV